MTGNILVKSEEQMEATAKELYSILGMEGDFIPQGKFGMMRLVQRRQTSVYKSKGLEL